LRGEGEKGRREEGKKGRRGEGKKGRREEKKKVEIKKRSFGESEKYNIPRWKKVYNDNNNINKQGIDTIMLVIYECKRYLMLLRCCTSIE
jgi:hypothetical protein